MIIFKDNNTVIKDPEAPVLDGVYDAVIASVYQNSNETDTNRTYSCVVYIPEVFGKYEKYNRYYPVVDIPFKQDNDDEGHEPQIGELVRVSFDDGNSNSCRLVYIIPTNTEVIVRNALYIKENVLPSTIINTDDPLLYENVLEWLDDAYLVTTGKHMSAITPLDYAKQYVVTANATPISNAPNKGCDNYFLKPLTIPFITAYSSNTDDTSEFFSFIPVFLSNIYLFADVAYIIQNEYLKQDIDTILNIYNNISTFISDPTYSIDYDILKDNEELIIMYMCCVLSGICPEHANILFPSLNDETLDKFVLVCPGFNYISGIHVWWNMYIRDNYNPQIADFVFSQKSKLEKEWANSCVSWLSAINNIVKDTTDVKMKETIILCFTIFPWITYPLLGYESSSASYINPNVLEVWYDFYNIDKRTYNTIFSSDDEFEETVTTLYTGMRQITKPTEFIDLFQKTTKKLYDKYNNDIFSSVSSWDECEMDDKFTRLRDLMS